MLTVNTIPPEKIEALKERGQELPREVVEIMAKKRPGGAAEQILEKLAELEPKGFVGHVVLDPDDDALIILWETVLPGEEED